MQLDWSIEGGEHAVLGRLKDNADKLVKSADAAGQVEGVFLTHVIGVFVETQEMDFREKMMAANRALTLKNEDYRRDHLQDQRDLKAAKEEIAALKARLKALEVIPQEAPAAEAPAEATAASLAPSSPAQECTCEAKDSDLFAFVVRTATQHGLEVEDLSFTFNPDAKTVAVSNIVPQRGRIRSKESDTVEGAVKSLREELNQ